MNYPGTSPMVTQMKSTHGAATLKYSVVKLYIALMLKVVQVMIIWGTNPGRRSVIITPAPVANLIVLFISEHVYVRSS